MIQTYYAPWHLYESPRYGSVSKVAEILGVCSNFGRVTLAVIGYYCSSKWALEAINESLELEVKAFGIKRDHY